MMHLGFRPAVAALSLLLLAGCGGGGLITNEYYGSYSNSLYTSIAAGRDLWVEVNGGVAGLDRATLEQAVERGLVGAGPAPRTHFTTRPGPTAVRDYRLVLLFGGSGGAGGSIVCSGAQPAGPPSSTIAVAAAMCYRGEALSSLNARSLAPTPTPAAVTSLVASLSPILLPDENPYYRPSDNNDFESR